MNGLQNLFSKQDDVHSLIAGIDEGLKEQIVSGLTGSSRSLLLASVYEKTNRPILLVTHNLLQAQKLHEDLSISSQRKKYIIYPANELIAADLSVASPELRAQRVEALNFWAEGKKGIVIAPIPGVRRVLPPKDIWKRHHLSLI